MGLEKINDMRKHVGINLDDLSEKSGVPKGTLSKITAGITKNPSVDTVKSIVHAMGFSLDDLDSFPSVKINNVNFSILEVEHIKKYRCLPDSGKEMVDMVLDKEYERVQVDQEEYIDMAARGGTIRITKSQAIELAKAAKDAPNSANRKDLF